jgi:Tol biopolymer transport system component
MARVLLASSLAVVLLCGMAQSAGFEGGGEGAVWSPDGTQVAYIGPAPREFVSPKTQTLTRTPGLNRVTVVAADGSGTRKVVATAPRGEILDEVRWAAGGRFVYEDSNYTLRSIDPASNVVARLGTVGVTGGVGEAFALSPNRRQVAFTAPCGCNVPQGTAVHLVATAGGVVRGLARPPDALDSDPSFSPDGKDLVFSRVVVGKSAPRNLSIVVESTRGGAARSLGVNGERPVFSPNGRWIAFVAPVTHQLELVRSAGGKPRALIPPRTAAADSFSWSPDSSRLAFVGPNKVGTVELGGKRTIFSLPGLRPNLHTPQWSPDGSSIAFSAIEKGADRDVRAYVIGADGTDLRRVA